MVAVIVPPVHTVQIPSLSYYLLLFLSKQMLSVAVTRREFHIKMTNLDNLYDLLYTFIYISKCKPGFVKSKIAIVWYSLTNMC